ncbi:UNVERIFIED_CONTAM: putative LRR receptor-like serine/threonine-protein kinase [Sesamum calycinum]|uniref:non-specific serine/threonine protein kinase n=1 Tax=Sesamum calycinum TaxID=2727403 RepID=A0AAW2J7P5_9LAMI
MEFFLAKRASNSANFVKRFILASVCATLVLTSAAQLLPEDEDALRKEIYTGVESTIIWWLNHIFGRDDNADPCMLRAWLRVLVLQTISSKLQNKYWNVNQSSCIGANGFNLTFWPDEIYSGVNCDCSFNSSTVCHVTNIQLKGLNLTGSLPAEFANLSHLQEIDLSRNYLNGSIPAEFGQLRLVKLVLEDNLLEGNLPANLGSLSNLGRLLLSANNFNGTIPVTFGNLRNLTDFRIDGSKISGRIPDFVGNWTKLDRLRISDLKGPSTIFPSLQDMTDMRELILRNCSIVGAIPPYLGDLSTLKTLDLSFNMLNGEIPSNFQGLVNLDFLFLSHNSLTGEVPGWILDSRQKNMDLSYNNFTQSSVAGCQFSNINLVASHSTLASNSIPWCLKPDLACPGNANHHSFFINCGGRRINFEGNEYEENLSDQGPSHFESYNNRWAYSSTGTYMGNDRGRFIAANYSSMVSPVAEIYQTARLSPSSLKYYGLCLRKGSYRVRLHFAEIMYDDNSTFTSLGRRIFDVAIQGQVVLSDFDIAQEAKGVRTGIYRDFNILVNGSTLEIHLYWTGKGTTAIPDRGVYGPLISAIAVTPNFDVSTGLSVGAIIGIVVSSCVVAVLLILLVLWRGGCLGKEVEDKELRALELQTGYFTLRQIKAATHNFDNANKIGEGGFGPVYKGVLSDGTVIAVKQLSAKSKQGNREFVNEIGMISALQHPNLVKLFGCCIEGNQLLLVYEYLENNSLARALFGREEQRLNLDWQTRQKICIGIARGLAYLHEESRLKIVHRDIKATNVLLDKDLNAKISDFGLAKLDEEENTHISTRIAGTVGYMAPEYAMRGYLTDKADVYSFGIVALEIAYVLQEQGNLLELVDPSLGSNYSKEEAMRMLNLALLCANPSPTLRPTMSSVVSMLEGKIPVQALVVKRGALDEDIRFKAFETLSQDSQIRVSTFAQDGREQRRVSMDGPWIDSSVTLSSKDESRDHSSASRLLPDLLDVKLD